MMIILASNDKPLLINGSFILGEAAPAVSGDFGIAMIGQSNMANRVTSGGAYRYPLGSARSTWYTTGGVRKRLGNYNDNGLPGTPNPYTGVSGTTFIQTDSSGDSQVYLANGIVAGLNVDACIINRAVGGSSINSWLTAANGGSGENWQAFVTALVASGIPLRLAIWHQGETDAVSMSAVTYKAKLELLRQQLVSIAADPSTFKMGITSIGPGPYNNSQPGDFGKIRVAQVEFATSTPGVFLASCAYDAGTGADRVHINGEGFNRIGRRELKAALHALGVTSAATGLGGSGAGPRVSGATRSGNVITVNIAHAGGTALTDGDGGSGSALTAFRVFDGGVQATISSTAIVGNTVRLTLASTPAGTVTLDHAMTDAPCHTGTSSYTFIPAACVYDNDGYSVGVGTAVTTVGSPLQPCATITVVGS